MINDSTAIVIRKICEESAERIANDLEFYARWKTKLIGQASPIEQIMFSSIYCYCKTQHQIYILESEIDRYSKDYIEKRYVVSVVPQFQVLKYRVDFQVSITEKDFKKSVLVECDSAKFHNTSPEHTKYEEQRQEEILAQKHDLIRFTGSDIMRNGLVCASHIFKELLGDLFCEY